MTQGPGGATAQHTIELRLSRFVSNGVHEDVDVTNFTQKHAKLRLELNVNADFADIAETKGERYQHGKVHKAWQSTAAGHTLTFSYEAEHQYSHQGHVGTAHLERGVRLSFINATSPPTHRHDTIRFDFELAPHATWHLCVEIIPRIDGHEHPSTVVGRLRARNASYDTRRSRFLESATTVSISGSGTLATVVVGALEQAKRDLATLRIHDIDHGEQAWTMAAGCRCTSRCSAAIR